MHQQQSPEKMPESPAAALPPPLPSSSSHSDSAGAEQSVANILMGLRNNYQQIDDSAIVRCQPANVQHGNVLTLPSQPNLQSQQSQQNQQKPLRLPPSTISSGQRFYLHPSTSSVTATTTPTTASSISSAPKRSIRDPSSHRESEKRRRERFNASLNELRELVPKAFVSKSCQNKVRLEKTEVINAAIAYIKHLKSNSAGAVNNNNGGFKNLDAAQLFLHEDFKKRAANAGVNFSDEFFYPNPVINGGILVRRHSGVAGGGLVQPVTTASDLLQDLGNGGSGGSGSGGGRARHSSSTSTSSPSTVYSMEEVPLSPFSSTREGPEGFIVGHHQQPQPMSMLTGNSCPISPIGPLGSGKFVYYYNPPSNHHQITQQQPSPHQQQKEQMVRVESGDDSGISVSDHMYPMTPVSSAGNSSNNNTINNNNSNCRNSGYNFTSL